MGSTTDLPTGETRTAGPSYSSNTGLKVSADETAAIKVAWEVPRFDVELRVLTATGQPRPSVDIFANWSTNTCGGHDRVARTDAAGTVRLHLDATYTALTLIIGGPYAEGDPEGDKNTRELSDAELHELFSKRKLTVRW